MRPAFIYWYGAAESVPKKRIDGIIWFIRLEKILTVYTRVKVVYSRKIHRHLLEYMIYWRCRTELCPSRQEIKGLHY